MYMKRWPMLFLSLFCSMSMLSGCATQQTPSATNARTLTASSGTQKVSMTLSPAHFLALHPVSIHVHITSTDHTSIVQSIQVKENMPDMSMPVPAIQLTKNASDTYSGTLVFVMTGPWTITLHEKTTTGSFTIPFHVQVQS